MITLINENFNLGTNLRENEHNSQNVLALTKTIIDIVEKIQSDTSNQNSQAIEKALESSANQFAKEQHFFKKKIEDLEF